MIFRTYVNAKASLVAHVFTPLCVRSKQIKQMSINKKELEDLAVFIREHRSNEVNFEKMNTKLEETKPAGYNDIKEKAEVYRQAKEKARTAWPEFEKFVSEFEKAVVEAMKQAA